MWTRMMKEAVLQSWSGCNMAGDEWRWEVFAVHSSGANWSIRARQIDEITGKVYRIRGSYGLKSARGVKSAIERIFHTDSIFYENIEADWDVILKAIKGMDPPMALALKKILNAEKKREEEALNPKETPESRYKDSIDQWLSKSSWPSSNATGACGLVRTVQNLRLRRAIAQYIDVYFKRYSRFPIGSHHVDVELEDLRHQMLSSDGIGRAIKAPGRIAISVEFPSVAQ